MLWRIAVVAALALVAAGRAHAQPRVRVWKIEYRAHSGFLRDA
jgi:hypothetical protein